MVLAEFVKNAFWNLFSQHYDYAAVYDGPEDTDVIYEGEIRIYLNGWVELENGRNLPANTIHHIQDLTFT
jgi:hypothetical protein